MIVYSVTVNIEDSVRTEWLDYMRNRHIPDIMATGLFLGYNMYRLMTRHEQETGTTYNIQYRLHDYATYERYQDEYAPALQQEHAALFAGKFVAFRSLLEEL